MRGSALAFSDFHKIWEVVDNRKVILPTKSEQICGDQGKAGILCVCMGWLTFLAKTSAQVEHLSTRAFISEDELCLLWLISALEGTLTNN